MRKNFKQLRRKSQFSRWRLIVFAVVVGLIGGYVIYRSFADTPTQGDLNNDGSVTILDLSILLSHYGQAATPSQGDINGDGAVGILDLSILLSNYGKTVSGPPGSGGVAPPSAPQTYTIPAGATQVGNSTQLINALAQSQRDIVLMNGTYDNTEPFYNTAGHRIYANNLGGAVLTAGLVIGGNFGSGGGLVRGVSFNVSSTGKTLQSGIIHTWGNAGVNAQILDCVFRGNNVIPYGINAANAQGLIAQRLEFYDFTDVGLRASNNTLVQYGGSTPSIKSISDIYVNGVSRAQPGASNGTAEAGVWIGHPVTDGVARIKIRNVSWSGIETVNNSWNTNFTDLDIDMGGTNQHAGIGVYMEHFTYYANFSKFKITGAKVGFIGEWADPDWDSKPGSNFNTIRDGTIDASGSTLTGNQAGVYLDQGSNSTTVTNVIFLNQNWAGIGAYQNVGNNVFQPNNFDGIKASAQPIRFAHLNS